MSAPVVSLTGSPCPAANLIGDEWAECGAPVVAVRDYTCIHEHVRRRGNCLIHEPVPGAVGCRECFDLGHECEMTAGPVIT